jgi:hypothetical protein
MKKSKTVAKFVLRAQRACLPTGQPALSRSRDNLPNPTTKSGNPYVPTNSPALDDLMGAFHFPTP